MVGNIYIVLRINQNQFFGLSSTKKLKNHTYENQNTFNTPSNY